MRRLRDIVYVNSNLADGFTLYYGIEFREFVKYIPRPIQNLLLLRHDYWSGTLSINSSLECVGTNGIDDLVTMDVCNYGDFCWVDYETERDPELLSGQEIAELLYLGHLHKPLGSPFFEKLNNQFAYCAHDDGWRCRLYCLDINDFGHVLEGVTLAAASTSKRRKIHPFPPEIRQKLLELSQDGLLIDYCNPVRNTNRIEIPIYTIGKLTDIDEMYNNLRRYVGNASYKAWIVHTNKSWDIADYSVAQ